MSSEGKYLNPNYENFFEKKLSDIDPEISKAIDDELNYNFLFDYNNDNAINVNDIYSIIATIFGLGL